MNSQSVTIKKPCHMKWKELDQIENSKNRHCNECSLDIIDFSQMSNEEIIEYLSVRKKEKVCAKMYSADKRSKLSKIQKRVLSWHENIKSNNRNNLFKPVVLALVGLMIIATGCVKAVGEPEGSCREEIVPDTTTVELGDSIVVEICG